MSERWEMPECVKPFSELVFKTSWSEIERVYNKSTDNSTDDIDGACMAIESLHDAGLLLPPGEGVEVQLFPGMAKRLCMPDMLLTLDDVKACGGDGPGRYTMHLTPLTARPVEDK